MVLRRYYNFLKNPTSLVFMYLPALFLVLLFSFTATGSRVTNLDLVSSMFGEIPTLVFVLNGAVYVTHLATERESKITPTMKVMGLRPVPYWLGTFVVDMGIALTSTVLSISPLFFLDAQGLNGFGLF